MEKLEEWVERSRGKVRADVAHEKLIRAGLHGFGAHDPAGGGRGQGGVSGWAPAGAPAVGARSRGCGFSTTSVMVPRVDGVGTQLFCAWLAWCRFRVVLALLDKTLPSVMAAIDQTLRIFGGVPTYGLTDNEKTVTSEHVAGIPVRNAADA